MPRNLLLTKADDVCAATELVRTGAFRRESGSGRLGSCVDR